MSQVTQDGFVFTIIDEIQTQYGELITLVLATESMDNSEKQYWFDILPSMTDIKKRFEHSMRSTLLSGKISKPKTLELKYLKKKPLIKKVMIRTISSPCSITFKVRSE
jgi:hypothetical protein